MPGLDLPEKVNFSSPAWSKGDRNAVRFFQRVFQVQNHIGGAPQDPRSAAICGRKFFESKTGPLRNQTSAVQPAASETPGSSYCRYFLRLSGSAKEDEFPPTQI